MATCFDIAQKFIDLANNDEEQSGIDPMKLIKLTYICYGFYQGENGQKLFDNKIQAWKYGPVILDLYHALKRYGSGTVPSTSLYPFQEEKLTDDESAAVEFVWGAYKKFSAIQLSTMTHQPDTPWAKTFEPNKREIEIPDSLIKDYYQRLIFQIKDKLSQSNPPH